MSAGGFKRQQWDSYSQDYEKSTPPRKDRLDIRLFAAMSLKPCPISRGSGVMAGAFARHGAKYVTNARHGAKNGE